MDQPTVVDHFTIAPAGEIHSRQRLEIPPPPTLPDDLTPLILAAGPYYFSRIARLSRGLIRGRERAGRFRLHLWNSPITLLEFATPVIQPRAGGGALVYPITGGLMSVPATAEGGTLSVAIERVETRLRLEMEVVGYHSRLMGRGRIWPLRRWFYRHTQAALHLLVARDFLHRLARAIRDERLAPV